jgi:hypothetical protein
VSRSRFNLGREGKGLISPCKGGSDALLIAAIFNVIFLGEWNVIAKLASYE